MIEIRCNPLDKRYIFLRGDDCTLPVKRKMKDGSMKTVYVPEIMVLETHLNKIPSYQFRPGFSGIPRAEVFLHKNKSKTSGEYIYWTYSGLWHEIYTWCKEHNVLCTGVPMDKDFKYTSFDWSKEKFSDWVKNLQLSKEPRDYQIEAAWKILKYRQSMSQLATRSGKTIMAYIIFRWMIENMNAHNILMIVPSIQLVKQGVKDMSEYKEFFKSETVWAKSELCESSNLTIGTFQSLVNKLDKKNKNYNPKFFDKFDVVCVDECHKAKCKSIDTILQQPFMKNVKLRFGFSGTIPEDVIDNYACQSLMGPKIQDITTKELIDSGYLADVEIEQYRIHYKPCKQLNNLYIELGEYLCSNYKMEDDKKVKLPKEKRRFLIQHEKVLPYSVGVVKETKSEEEYIEYIVDLCKAQGSNLLLLEQMLMFESKKRMKVIEDIVTSTDKNYIVFAHHTEYLKYLYDYFSQKLPNKTCLLINGATALKNREKVISTMEDNNSCILFASYACVGTGLTFKNIDYGIFAESFKSQIINKQSLGRGLLLAPGKDKFVVYDIIDCFPTKRLEFQGKTKESMFKKEGFKVKITDM